MVWSRQDGFHTTLETPNGVLAQHDGWQGALIAPSPDGRYGGIAGGWSQPYLWVYDIDLKKWTDLGEADIHPDRDWDLLIGLFRRQRRGGETVAVDSTSGASHDQPNC
jgi:hypothetical protein